METLANKVALITGASAGIGEAAAVAFAEQGVHLILAARRLAKVQALAERCQREFAVNTLAIELDVTDNQAVEQAVVSLPESWQCIDILVNNAGLARGMEPFHQGSPADWDEMIDTNIKGLLYVSRAVAPKMVKRGCGHIINLGSIAGYQAYANGAVYCATKFAVRGITEGMKQDLHGTGVRVSEVAPGMVQTDFSRVRFKGDEQRAEQVYQNIQPLTAEDIANTLVYCAAQPPHVDVLTMAVWPTAQSSAKMFDRQES